MKIPSVAYFAMGAVVGFVVGNFALKRKYEQKMDEGIQSVREAYGKDRKVVPPVTPVDNDLKNGERVASANGPEIASFDKVTTEEGYKNYSACTKSPADTPTVNDGSIDDQSPGPVFIVSPSEFQMEDGYRTLNFTWYADCVLADEQDDIVDYPDIWLGTKDVESILTENEVEVFLRNDERSVYIDIVRDDRSYYGDIVPDEED